VTSSALYMQICLLGLVYWPQGVNDVSTVLHKLGGDYSIYVNIHAGLAGVSVSVRNWILRYMPVR
jgi:hypothetical protein